MRIHRNAARGLHITRNAPSEYAPGGISPGARSDLLCTGHTFTTTKERVET